MTRARDLPLDETLSFVRPWLPPRARLLEVGAGDGALARRLLDAGHSVVALDIDAAAVAAAVGLGVDARRLDFPAEAEKLGERRFDAILFTRSLHHLAPLDRVIGAAAKLLVDGGRLVVEDWAWNRVDRPTIAWMLGFLELGRALELFTAEEWSFGSDPLAAWLREHEEEHHLHRDETMRAAIAATFAIEHEERAPYFYRYVARYLDGHPLGRKVAAKVLTSERALIAANAIVPFGWRLVGRRS